MSAIDFTHLKCDKCGKEWNDQDDSVTDFLAWNVPGSDYPQYCDLCESCVKELGVSNCAHCGGIFKWEHLNENYYCPNCVELGYT